MAAAGGEWGVVMVMAPQQSTTTSATGILRGKVHTLTHTHTVTKDHDPTPIHTHTARKTDERTKRMKAQANERIDGRTNEAPPSMATPSPGTRSSALPAPGGRICYPPFTFTFTFSFLIWVPVFSGRLSEYCYLFFDYPKRLFMIRYSRSIYQRFYCVDLCFKNEIFRLMTLFKTSAMYTDLCYT